MFSHDSKYDRTSYYTTMRFTCKFFLTSLPRMSKKRRSCCNQSGLLHRPGWKAEKLTREVKLKYKKVLLATCVFSCIKNMEVSCCSYRSKFENLAVTQQL